MKRLRFAAVGAALAYFFDPQNGRRRRTTLVDRLAGLARGRGERRAEPELSEELAGRTRSVRSAHETENVSQVAGE